jgi:protein-S-isoprenylcysteine O-methyltransferase Ste14
MAVYSFIAMCAYMLAIVIGQSVVGSFTHARNIRRGDVWLRFLGASVMPLLMIPAMSRLKDQPVRPVWMVLGSALIVCGLFISLWSQWCLGRFWVGGIGLHKGHQLITSGPYRYVRHPLYSGMVISTIGIGVFSLSPILFLAVFCFFGGFMLRIPAEEQMMRNKFKRRHEAYVAKTGLLFPRLRKE